ncbi:MAG: malto-oligosyltrehalose trehalohydrolase [Planctomycetes bacterium]|nr:malto-oligosyltrehalose trehalohydrolase [Planctomycetota bacterium]
MRLGATLVGDGRTEFRVWAPSATAVEVHLVAPRERWAALEPAEDGYHVGVVEGVEVGARYLYRLERGLERPDPASRRQPLGVHGPSEVLDGRYRWTDADWRGLPLERLVLYELHVGAASPEGTCDGVLRRVPGLKALGVTALELMPVAQCPGVRNWGYDGVYPFAVSEAYGGADGLRRLVDACHAHGLAVLLDVVYNHLGPEGNYLSAYGPYFTDRYRTPWGDALNFDGPGSDEVRRFFLENALEWVVDFHVDGLRLDALHAIVDSTARTFLQELAERVHAEAERLGRPVHLIAEVDRNDPRFVLGPERGGYGLDAQWNDDFHHSLRTLLTGETGGYLGDYGTLGHLARSFQQGYVYAGERSKHRGRRHGADPHGIAARQLVVFAQNHDQVGNRPSGDRLGALVDFDSLKLAAAATLLAPFVPLLFMGEEYGETAPFPYFADHGDEALREAVRRGRRAEMEGLAGEKEPPDPFAEGTFRAAKLDERLGTAGRHRRLYEYYRTLLSLRREVPALATLDFACVSVTRCESARALVLHRRAAGVGEGEALVVLGFAATEAEVALPALGGGWRRRLDSADATWGGGGTSLPERLDLERPTPIRLAARSAGVFVREAEAKPERRIHP